MRPWQGFYGYRNIDQIIKGTWDTFVIFCILGVHRRRKLVNIGEEEESGMSSEVNFNAWGGGGVVCIAKHTYTHACIHIYSEVNFNA